jgi:hypothetical protein
MSSANSGKEQRRSDRTSQHVSATATTGTGTVVLAAAGNMEVWTVWWWRSQGALKEEEEEEEEEI